MNRLTKKTYQIYWQHIKKHKWVWLLTILSLVSAACIGLIPPLLYKEFFDILASGKPADTVTAELFSILGFIFLAWLGVWACWRAAGFLNSYFQTTTKRNLSNTSFAYLHKHSFRFFHDDFVGSLVKKVNRFSNSFSTIDDILKFDVLSIIIEVTAIIIILSFRDIRLSLGILVWVFVVLSINYWFSQFKLKYDFKRSELNSKTTGVLADTITNQENVKLFAQYEQEKKRFFDVSTELRDIRLFAWNLGEIFEAIQVLLMIFLEIGVVYLAIGLWADGTISIGDFVLIQAYLIRIFHKLWSIGRTIRRFYEAVADAQEMTEIFDTPHEIKDRRKAKDLVVSGGEISFDRVYFSYHKTRKIVADLSITFRPGERVALVGPSGAGKSTIVKLLLRQFDVSRGKIYVDGQKITEVSQESLRSQIGFVPQDSILFHRTLFENIRYGKPDATKEEVIEASKLAHCHEFINELPEKYETSVGERGVKLSGGERQRVAIARAILKNAPILVLDEATSSLDSESEAFIQDALDYLMKDKTVIVIAHRLSTIMKMDRILVLDHGAIIEDGSHKKLLKKRSGVYKRLWKLQAGGFIG